MGGATFLGSMWYVPCVVLRAHLAGLAKSDTPTNGPHIARGPSLYSPRSIASLTFVEESLCGDPKAMRWEQGVCFAIFHIFVCPLGGSARDLSKRPKWSTYVESEVIGVKSLCLEGLVHYSIQAEDIMIYLCAFQGPFGCFFANIAVFCPS